MYNEKLARKSATFHIQTVRHNLSTPMEIDKKLNILPLTKSKPSTLESLFGKTEIEPMWVADMEFEVAKSIQKALIKGSRILDSVMNINRIRFLTRIKNGTKRIMKLN